MSTRETKLLVALAVVALLWLLSRTQGGQAVTAKVADAVGSAVRGIRNNNPGNIRLSADQWQGMRGEQTDGAFVQFTEMRYGVRAAVKVFRNYQSRYGLRTVAALIARWAPSTENDTAAYVKSVSARVGVADTSPLDLTNVELVYRFLRAVFRHECGIAAEAIPEGTLREGIALAA